ncbi:MAG: hypothetical protein WDO24_07270 [Pseudomonadota bacterium]
MHEPVFGCLLAEGRKPSGHVFRAAELIKPGFENELCIELGRDLPAGADPRRGRRGPWPSIAPALEIIETRGDFTRQLAVRARRQRPAEGLRGRDSGARRGSARSRPRDRARAHQRRRGGERNRRGGARPSVQRGQLAGRQARAIRRGATRR